MMIDIWNNINWKIVARVVGEIFIASVLVVGFCAAILLTIRYLGGWGLVVGFLAWLLSYLGYERYRILKSREKES